MIALRSRIVAAVTTCSVLLVSTSTIAAWNARPATVRGSNFGTLTNKMLLSPVTLTRIMSQVCDEDPTEMRPESDIDIINVCLLTDEYRTSYLERIGFSKEEVNELISSPPDLVKLQKVLTAHLRTVPFENMDQIEHPSHGDTPLIPRRSPKQLPSLNVYKSLEKIIFKKRGGFCFELNFTFRLLLSSLGYRTRLVLADVACSQPVPGHVVILVDDVLDMDEIVNANVPVLVDVGFGDPGVCDVLLPVQYNVPKEDTHGDLFEFRMDNDADGSDRFDTQLCRTRILIGAKGEAEGEEEKMYRFRLDDDMDMAAAEFSDGLDRVLFTSPTFNGKRICVLSDNRGHVTLGKDYIKWVEKGESVKRIELPTETHWQAALKDHFGVTL